MKKSLSLLVVLSLAGVLSLLSFKTKSVSATPVLLETIYVDSYENTNEDSVGVIAYSINNLVAGKKYIIEASGVYIFKPDANPPIAGLADSNYLLLPANTDYNPGPDPVWKESGAVWVDGKHVGWGSFNLNHVYQINYTGTGNRATFNIWDTDHSDNVGKLTIKIFGSPELLKDCTLSQGYWKKHPENIAWLSLKDQMFFNSGLTYLQVMSATSSGNAYYKLARQYVATSLNSNSGVTLSGNILSVYNESTELFSEFDPDEIAILKGSDFPRNKFIYYAGVLESFNTGSFGSGKCNEDVEEEIKKEQENISDDHKNEEIKNNHEVDLKDGQKEELNNKENMSDEKEGSNNDNDDKSIDKQKDESKKEHKID